MSKIKMALNVAEDLKRLAGSIEELVRAMEADSSRREARERMSEAPKDMENITIERVRAVLADKSKEGKLDAVKELINRYGASKLTDVDPKRYVEMLKEASCL